MDRLVELGHREVERTRGQPEFHPLAQMYRDRFTRIRETFRRYEGNVPRAFAHFEGHGRLGSSRAT